MNIIQAKCPTCFIVVNKAVNEFNRLLKNNPNYIIFCSTKCRSLFFGTKLEIACTSCGLRFQKLKCCLSDSGNNFCSRKCSITFSNHKRKKNEIKVIRKRITRIKHCISCNKETSSKKAKYCKGCLLLFQRKFGCELAIKRKNIKRSKNEMYFFDLCKSHYDNVSHNQNIFDGWDADILLHDYKVAVLWNGPWHYVDCGGKHSVKQTQIRDKFKIEKIKQSNWIVYIIKDFENFSHGKYSTKFVEQEFEKFKEFIKNVNV